MQMVLLIGSATLLLTATLAFLIVFAREPWARHPFGQSVMVLTLGVVVLASQSILTYALGQDYAARVPLVVAGRALVAAGILQRLWVLVRLRRADRTP